MQHLTTNYKSKKRFCGCLLPFSTTLIYLAFCCLANSQSCPPNIDFENGTFEGWNCYTGFTSAVGDENFIYFNSFGGPAYNHHTMYSANTGQLDPYGGFPVICPNGSGHSIKLGSTEAGGQAEGVSYQFTIPANADSYSITYNYAVVFQSPDHRINEQPRMTIEVLNVTDNKVIDCGSFDFIAVGSSLPGFEISHYTDTITVLYKPWSAVSVDLSGMAGKTIRLFFKTADCTFRRHFGYAYVDVNSECDGGFIGSRYCPDDTAVHVTAPFGYSRYTWYDSTLTSVIGNQQTISFIPPPVSGTTVAVKLDPYDGYGCPKTLYAYLQNTLVVTSNAGIDTLSCNLRPVSIGVISKPGLSYQWAPPAGLSNPNISNPLAFPGVTTPYIVTTRNLGGGCITTDTVIVRSSIIDSSLRLIGKAAFCFGYGDSAVLAVHPTQRIQWFMNGNVLNGGNGTNYHVGFSGDYHAMLINASGCTATAPNQPVLIDRPLPGITYPTQFAIIDLPLDLAARNIGEQALWNPPINLNDFTSFTPFFRGVSEQLYTIEIKTKAGCLTVDTQLVKTVRGVEIYVPTAFTPNKDGANDFLRPIMRGVKELRFFRVFNRWGKIVFETRTALPGWDGMNKGVPQQLQAVVWMLQCVGVDGVVYSRKGSSVLLR